MIAFGFTITLAETVEHPSETNKKKQESNKKKENRMKKTVKVAVDN